MLFDHSISSHQDIRRNRQADLLGRLKIDYELELYRLLNGKVSGLSTFEDLVYIISSTAILVGEISS